MLLIVHASARNEAAARLLTGLGFALVRHPWRMVTELHAPPIVGERRGAVSIVLPAEHP